MAETVFVITGPTASGKTWAAVSLAGQRSLEAISADSRQVYQNLDIGTAKPTPAEQARLPHHLVGFLPPTASYSAGQFMHDATALLPQVRQRGALPLVVGGTGMYLRGFVQGYQFSGQGSDPAIRASLQKRYRQEGGEALLAELAQTDPDYARTIHPNDQLRVVRGLEIIALTGHGPGQQPRREQEWAIEGVALLPDLKDLEARIGQRTEQLFESGWREEVAALLEGGLDPACPALQSIGYPEVVALAKGEISQDKCLRAVITRTRQYARKQLQLLRTFTGLTAVQTPEEAVERMLALVEKH